MFFQDLIVVPVQGGALRFRQRGLCFFLIILMILHHFIGQVVGLIFQIKLYLGDDSLRSRVSVNGNRRVINDGHDVASCMASVLDFVA